MIYWNRETAQKQFRPEQFKLLEYFNVYAPKLEVVLEMPVTDKQGQIIGIPDLLDITNEIIWLLDGGSHGGKVKKVKDERQIEKYELAGYSVKVILRDSFLWNWLWD